MIGVTCLKKTNSFRYTKVNHGLFSFQVFVDDADNKEFLKELLKAMYEELPAPKKEK